jgi:hypothetical protein
MMGPPFRAEHTTTWRRFAEDLADVRTAGRRAWELESARATRRAIWWRCDHGMSALCRTISFQVTRCVCRPISSRVDRRPGGSCGSMENRAFTVGTPNTIAPARILAFRASIAPESNCSESHVVLQSRRSIPYSWRVRNVLYKGYGCGLGQYWDLQPSFLACVRSGVCRPHALRLDGRGLGLVSVSGRLVAHPLG